MGVGAMVARQVESVDSSSILLHPYLSTYIFTFVTNRTLFGDSNMEKIKFVLLFHLNGTASLDRPAWTSTQETGMFNAYQHKHSIERGRFCLQIGYWAKRRII